MVSRPVAVPVMAKLVIKGTMSASRLWLARRMVERLAREFPGRRISVTAGSAYAGPELKKLPAGVTWTTRLRANAALYALPPARTGKKGRPRKKGDKLASLKTIAKNAVTASSTVKNARTASARTANRRGHPRTVSAGRLSSRAIVRCPARPRSSPAPPRSPRPRPHAAAGTEREAGHASPRSPGTATAAASPPRT